MLDQGDVERINAWAKGLVQKLKAPAHPDVKEASGPDKVAVAKKAKKASAAECAAKFFE